VAAHVPYAERELSRRFLMTIMTVPDSDLARSAMAMAAEVEPAFLINHSERTFHLGAQLLLSAGRTFDSEILYVASMLHDLALGTELDDGTTPFQMRGGGIAVLSRSERSGLSSAIGSLALFIGYLVLAIPVGAAFISMVIVSLPIWALTKDERRVP
jgi:hypothetical protein